MKRFTVAHVAACQFPVNYGSPAAIRELVEMLSEAGHRIHVITYPDGQDMSVGQAVVHRVGQPRPARDLTVGPSWTKPLNDLLMVFKLVQIVRREKIEIIHAHNYEGCLVGVLGKFLTGRPLIYNAVNLMADELETYGFLPRWVARRVARLLDWFVPIFPDHIVAVTPELHAGLRRSGVAEERLTLVPCGMRPEIFEGANPEPLRAQLGIGSRPVVMYTGINNAFQRVDYLLRAFTVVRREIPDALLLIVSPIENEPNRPANEALARELGIDADTRFIGPHSLEQLKDYLALADVCVVPRTDCPGHPIKLLNYMVARKPIVSFVSAAKGVQHLREAWLAPDHDWNALGEGIITLLRDRPLAERLAATARETALREFDWRQLGKKIEAIYESLLRDRGLVPNDQPAAS